MPGAAEYPYRQTPGGEGTLPILPISPDPWGEGTLPITVSESILHQPYQLMYATVDATVTFQRPCGRPPECWPTETLARARLEQHAGLRETGCETAPVADRGPLRGLLSTPLLAISSHTLNSSHTQKP